MLELLRQHGELGTLDIAKRLDLKNRKHVRTAYINPALEQGLIEYSIPDKPSSRLQKYRLKSKQEHPAQKPEVAPTTAVGFMAYKKWPATPATHSPPAYASTSLMYTTIHSQRVQSALLPDAWPVLSYRLSSYLVLFCPASAETIPQCRESNPAAEYHAPWLFCATVPPMERINSKIDFSCLPSKTRYHSRWLRPLPRDAGRPALSVLNDLQGDNHVLFQ
ncbi:Fic family protein [Thiopseudomonas denitrificans]|uniref:Fic family protein n=1 Tax=Thiopseudomonas denitrificans TaxID=1501432 RepID=UPI003B83304D